MKGYGSQIATLIVAALIALYFWLKWWAVVVCLFVLLFCLIWRIVRRRKTTATQSYKPKSAAVEENPIIRQQERLISRRKAQGEAIRTLSFVLSSQNKSCDRVIKHLLDWHLEYSRKSMIYHTDLYDYLIDCAQQRLKTAKADYLKHELRLTISVVRKFMRGETPESVAAWLTAE